MVAILSLATALTGLTAAATPAAAAGEKVVIIVGPTGSITDFYRKTGDAIASTAAAAGANVVKVYSPNATWQNVRAATEAANLIVYLGHGNGYPNPYNSSENTNSTNGWGLNRTTTNGDADDWTSTLVYCGENALLGTLPSSLQGWKGGQWEYCGGSTGTQGIHPAPGFVMVYQGACYAPGAGETADATLAMAQERVRNYSFPVFSLGGSAYFANDIDASSVVDLVLRDPGTPYGEIAQQAAGYSSADQVHVAHPDVPGAEIWVQKTYALYLGRSDYWYAFAGKPTASFGGPAASTTFDPDLTTYDPAATLGFPAGSYTGYKFSDAGAILGSRSYTLTRSSSAPTTARRLFPGRSGYFYYVSAGVWDGYWVPESSGVVLANVPTFDPDLTTYDPAATLGFPAGSYTGYKFSDAGAILGSRSYTLTRSSSAPTTARRLFPGRSGYFYYVSAGVWDGYWVPESSGVVLANVPTFDPDLTTYDPAATLGFPAGSYTGYKFSDAGAILGSRSYTLTRSSSAPTTARRLFPGRSGYFYYVSAGVWDGYWVPESSGVVLANVPTFDPDLTTYDPAATLGFPAGSYTGYKFSDAGAVLGSRSYTLTRSSSAPTTARRLFPGRSGYFYYVSAGVWDGYWVPESSGVWLVSGG